MKEAPTRRPGLHHHERNYTMSIEMFDFKGREVRVMLDDQGESRWVASDVAKALGYRDAERMTRMIDEEDKGYSKVGTLGGEQVMTVINESGLYTALFRSNLEDVKPFRRWVTDEVLPSIRKHGGYISEHATVEQVEALQRELSRTKDQLTEAVRREDRTYGEMTKLQDQMSGLLEAVNFSAQRHHSVSVYEYIVHRTEHHGFASKWTFQLAKDTMREWPYVYSEDGELKANEADLDEAWDRREYAKEFYLHTHDGELPKWL